MWGTRKTPLLLHGGAGEAEVRDGRCGLAPSSPPHRVGNPEASASLPLPPPSSCGTGVEVLTPEVLTPGGQRAERGRSRQALYARGGQMMCENQFPRGLHFCEDTWQSPLLTSAHSEP